MKLISHPKVQPKKHIIIKLPKINDKEKNFKAAKEFFFFIYKAIPIGLSAIFLTIFKNKHISGQGNMDDIFKRIKEKLLTKNTLPSKFFFRNKEEIETILNKS